MPTTIAMFLCTASFLAGSPHAEREGAVPGDSTAILATVTAFHAALAAGDSAAALALLAPDAVVLESGEVETRAEYAAHHLAADIEFSRAVPSQRVVTWCTRRAPSHGWRRPARRGGHSGTARSRPRARS